MANRNRARTLISGVAIAALLTAGCANLRGDIVWGTLRDLESNSATLTLGHTEDQTSYLFVCPGTSEKDLRAVLGDLMPRNYPDEGYPDKGGVALIPAQGPAKLRTYPTDEFDMCRVNSEWQPTPIDTKVTMRKDADGVWYPLQASASSSSEDSTATPGEQSSTGISVGDHSPTGDDGEQPAAGPNAATTN